MAPSEHTVGLGAWKALTRWKSAHVVMTLSSSHFTDGDSEALNALMGLDLGFPTSALLTFWVG